RSSASSSSRSSRCSERRGAHTYCYRRGPKYLTTILRTSSAASLRREHTCTSPACCAARNGRPRHTEHGTARLQQLWVRSGIECRIKRPLGERHVAGGGDKCGEAGISDSVPIDAEAGDGYAVRRSLLGIMACPIPSGTCHRESVPCRWPS